MDGEADALALDDARIEDSVTCEGCGATFDIAEVVESPYEADDGGAYCAECATKEWARVVEENSRLREALQEIAGSLDPAKHRHGLLTKREALVYEIADEALRAALAPAAGEGDRDER